MSRKRRAAARREKAASSRAGTSGLGRAKDPVVERAKNTAAMIWTAFPMAAFLILAGAADRAKLDPSVTDPGKNWPGDLQATLIQAAIGTVVLALILRPWSFRDSVERLVLALALFAPWTAFNLLTLTHVGEVIGAHLFWLLVVCASLAYGIVKVAAARRNQPSPSPRPHG